SAADAVKQLDASLKSLKTDVIDLYQFHSGDDREFQNDELWSALRKQQQGGKIRHLGISILGKGSELQAREAKRVGAEGLQVIYNRLDRRPEEQVFPQAKRDNLGVLARVPLASGFLTGKYKPGTKFTGNDARATFDVTKMSADLNIVEKLKQTEVPPDVP